MNIVWYIIEAVNVIIEILVVFLFFSKLLTLRFDSKIVCVIGYVISAVILYFAGLFTSNGEILISITFVLLLLISNILYNGKFTRKLISSVSFIVLVTISEILFISTMNMLNIGTPTEILAKGLNRGIGMIGVKIVYFWLVIICCNLINKKVKAVPIKYGIMIILMPVVSTVILCILFNSLIDISELSGTMTYIIAVTGLLYINYSVFDFFETYTKQVRLSVLEQIIEHETTNYKLIEKSYLDMRKLKHDIGNQLKVVTDLIEQKKFGSVEKSLNNISGQLNNICAICYTGEPVIDSIINTKSQMAAEYGIEFSQKMNVQKFYLDTIELCRALGNALDNAIEGCQRSKNIKPHIYISIQQIENKIVVSITNTSDKVDLANLQTKKKNKSAHGIGLSSIKASVEKLNGHLNYEYEDNIFSLNMVICNI